jgi:hypothetical protein
MTVDRSKIDEIFRKKLSDHEVVPPFEVWEDIVIHVAERRKARKKRMYMQIAASLIVLVVAGTLLFNPSGTLFNENGQTPGKPENQTFSNFVEEPGPESEQMYAVPEVSGNKETVDKDLVAENIQQDAGGNFPSEMNADEISALPFETEMSEEEVLKEKETLIAGIPSDAVENNGSEQLDISQSYQFNAFNNEFFASDNVTAASEIPKNTHFSLKATMAPVMSYRRLENNASRANFNTSESELFSYTGGLNFGYKLSERLSVHSGFYYAQIGQTVNKIRLGSDDFAQHDDDIFIRLNNSLGEVEVAPAKLLSAKRPEKIENIVNGNRLLKFSYKLDASVVQRFEYVKIPLMVEYTMIDKKIDLNLIGGFNSNFLVNEGVYLKNQTGKAKLIGNTTHIRQFNYSGAVGLGLEYNLTRQINMYFEPHMDYFLNPINYSETKTYPYSFAVHTGLSITF